MCNSNVSISSSRLSNNAGRSSSSATSSSSSSTSSSSSSATSSSSSSSATSSSSGKKQRGKKLMKQQGSAITDGEDESLLRRALAPGNYTEWHKDEALDVFWWLKQIVAVALGITLGIFRVTGWLGFLLFAAIQFLAANAWAERAQIVGVFFDHFDIFTENTLVALGTFLVCWMLSFTLTVSHFGGP